MQYAIITLFVLAMLCPVYLMFRKKLIKTHTKPFLTVNIIATFGLCLFVVGSALSGHALAAGETAETAVASILSLGDGLGAGIGLIGAGLVTGLSCLGAGIAVSGAASAALGAISENEKLFGKAFVMVVLAEGIAIYGMLISVLILQKI